MAKNFSIFFLLITILYFNNSKVFSQGNPDFNGKWVLLKEKSTEIDLFENLSLEISQNKNEVTLDHVWGGGRRPFKESLILKTDGKGKKIPIKNRVFTTNAFMGLTMPVGEDKTVKAVWENENTLKFTEEYKLIGSQGEIPFSETSNILLSSDKETITYTIDRDTRKGGEGIKYVLKKAGLKNAYYMKFDDNWEIDANLPNKAMLISLQGIVNAAAGPKIYYIFGEQWDYHFTQPMFDYFKSQRNYTFTQLNTAEQALNTFKKEVKGYIVWDKQVRTSLIVAFTLAGLESSIVISEDLIPMVEKTGLKCVEDFRNKFTGKSDVEIYSWAYDKYWDRCSRDLIIWMGGEHGKVMKPGIADFGIMKKAFFNDLSTRVTDTAEYNLAKKLLSGQKPFSMVMGWHSYKKDAEREHVKLTSSYALRVDGLHTLPNVSFSSQLPLSPGFKFKNQHNIIPGKKYIPEKKVYLTCIQTDCLGIGSWNSPTRGKIPYAWEVTMNWIWIAPAMLEYYYSQATPNDYFIGALGGPGYVYPKAVPPKHLPKMLEMTKELMDQLDLNSFDIMDYSEGATTEGNSELTKEICEAFYKAIPNSIGFVNGYAPSYTFTVKDKVPFISFEYYLSQTRTEADAVTDLIELSRINSKRPYFLLMHVRNFSDMTRVKSIVDKLGSEFELVPLDIFFKMAGEEPTFKEKFLKK